MSSSSHSLGLEQGGVANGGEQLTVQSSQIICLEKHLNQEGTIIDQAGLLSWWLPWYNIRTLSWVKHRLVSTINCGVECQYLWLGSLCGQYWLYLLLQQQHLSGSDKTKQSGFNNVDLLIFSQWWLLLTSIKAAIPSSLHLPGQNSKEMKCYIVTATQNYS